MEPMRRDVRQDDVAAGVFTLIMQHETATPESVQGESRAYASGQLLGKSCHPELVMQLSPSSRVTDGGGAAVKTQRNRKIRAVTLY